MAADQLSPGEVLLLDLARCAVLRAPAVPSGRRTVPPLHPQLSYRAVSSRARTVTSLGIGELTRRSQVVTGEGGAVAQDQHGAGWAWPARLELTDRRLLGIGAPGTVWTWVMVEVIEVVHSGTEPCTVVRYPTKPDCVLLVPLADADAFRVAFDRALAPGDGPGPGQSAVVEEPSEGSEPPEGSEPSDGSEPSEGSEPSPWAAPAGGGNGRVATGFSGYPAEAEWSPDGPVTTAVPAGETGETPARRKIRAIPGFGDRVFHGWSWLGGLSVLAIMALVGLFLLVQALTALRATGLSFLTTSEWQPDTHHFGIAAVLTGTVLIALVALAVSIPLAIGTALFISEAAPRRLKQTFISMVDLMAAVPSIVYGLWGLFFFQSHIIGVSRWISTWFAWIPIFKVQGADPNNPLASKSVYTASTFIAGLVVALMVIPISCSIMREVFSQAPAGEREGAYALGATRWGMIRSVVLPFGKGGMIGAVMLGLGRALGETIAVYLIISPVFTINFHILQTGSNSVASLIVLRTGDASGFGRSALMAAGLSLFVLTLIVNFTASAMVARTRSGAQSEA